MTTHDILVGAKETAPFVSALSTDEKNNALSSMADALISAVDEILSANAIDMERAKDRISPVMLDRLRLDEGRIRAMADGIRAVAALPDPCGKLISEAKRDDGLLINKISVPLGVVAIIYESRPNVTSDAAALTIKSGNVCVLRTGKDAFCSANAIVKAMRRGLLAQNIPEKAINLIEDTSHDSANEIMRAKGLVDVLIPRGGAGLIRACVENSIVPCIETGTGICHIYVDADADFDKALDIIENAKTSRPSVCNAEEVLLVDASIADKFLPLIAERLTLEQQKKGKTSVELRLCERASKIIDGTLATAEDFDTEFLDYILAVKVVDGVKDAVSHIMKHTTGHSEAIITENKETADCFVKFVDCAALYVNASTRFTDGGEFGLGCEMGISTQKLHARGPMGLCELTSYKYVVLGNGHIR